jgi:Rrf2 family transcriptional regulator, iron-sulfur cluster assembly transcription factor
MIVTQDIKLMVHLVTYIRLNSDGKTPVKLEDVAKDRDVSLSFLEQVARRMRLNKLITSVRGPGGGYLMAQDRISLADLYRCKKHNNAPEDFIDQFVIRELYKVVL